MNEIQDRAAIVRFTPEALTALLQLPEGACIDAVQSRADEIGTIEVRIRGAGWPVVAGHIIRHVTPIITKRMSDDQTLSKCSLEWKFPE